MKKLFICLLICVCLLSRAHAEVRLKDIVDIEGVRGNDLVGYGLVIGLHGSGDTLRNTPFTEEAMENLLERLGVNIEGEDFRSSNVAAVLVTAKLPPFARAGSKIDVVISSIGDAKSISGGTLIMTPLSAADNEIYAVAQGSVLVSGFSAQGDAGSITQGVPTVGNIPAGARVEREVNFDFADMKTIRLALHTPDFTTASRIEMAVNSRLRKSTARMLDAGTVELDLRGASFSPARMISMIENVTLSPDQRAKVVIDQRSGTIVLGADVKISPVAVAQGSLSIKIAERPFAVQPNPFSQNGETVVLPRTDIEVLDAAPGNIAQLHENVSLSDLVGGLNALGVSPLEMIDILKALKTAGALHAELILQ